MRIKLIDAHVHLHEFSREYISSLKDSFYRILAVSEDYESSLRTLELSKDFDFIIPGIGIYPSEINKNNLEGIKKILARIDHPFFFGEIGMDKKFKKIIPLGKQKEVLEFFLKLAKDYDVPVNLHSRYAWRNVLDLVLKYDLDKVIFHWYTGPNEILEEIIGKNYFITLNLAIKIQPIQKEILEIVPLKNLLPESDGPYDYRGIRLEPKTLLEFYEIVSERRNIDIISLAEQFLSNLHGLFKI